MQAMRIVPTPLRFGAAVAVLAIGATFSLPVQAIDWDAVPGTDVTLFYPGQASWEWVLTKSDHSGAPKFREGKNCIECHGGEEADMGALIVSGKKLEPTPIPGKRGSVKATVKAANDGQRLYVRLEWPEAPALTGPKMDPDFENKVTMMIDDGHVLEAKRAGCWGACHDDAIGMASAKPGTDLTKYLAHSRTKITRQGGDENYKSDAEIAEMLADGQYLEYWQARFNKDGKPVAVDGYILESRHQNESALVNAEASLADGNWTVVLSRALQVGAPGHKNLAPGTIYNVGFAIHDGNAAHRFHYVSFEHTLVLDQGNADIVAVRQ
jgi:hypothetical protein